MSKATFKVGDDINLSISEGLITAVKHIGKFGYNANLSTGVEALLWPGPTAEYIFPSDTGESMRIVSAQAADNQLMLVQALDQDWNEVNISVNLEGTTPVMLPGNLSRINRVINVDATETTGVVSVTNAAGTVTYALVLVMEQITTQLVFSVPLGFKAKLEDSFVTLNKSGGASASVIFRYRRREFGGVFGTGARFGLSKTGTSATTLFVGNVTPLAPKSDVVLLALADANNTDVSARVPFTLYKTA